jgi:hypothetical protein
MHARKEGHLAAAELIHRFTPETPDQVVVRSPLGHRTLEEIFNFAALERVSVLNTGTYGPAEAFLRESFSTLQDQEGLRLAFAEHKRRGGTRSEDEVFPNRLVKSPSLR